MALESFARVAETTTSTGAGNLTLAGAVTNMRAVGDVHADGATLVVLTYLDSDWEIARVTYTASGNYIARTAILASTNAGAAVNWGVGTKTIKELGVGALSEMDATGLSGLRTLLGVTAAIEAAANAGHLHGFTLSNGTDATNDIDFAAGKCRDSTDVTSLVGAAMTKRLDAAWAVGSGAGGRMSAAAIANTTYHCFAIRKDSDGSVDYGFDVSATAPTMPSGYTYFRRIGSILREAGAIVAFTQIGDMFKRPGAIDRNSTAAAASALLALSVPLGIVVQPIVSALLNGLASVICIVQLGDAAFGSANTDVIRMQTGAGDSVDLSSFAVPPIFSTNTSAQLYFSQSNAAGTPSNSVLTTFGWVDTRGRLA